MRFCVTILLLFGLMFPYSAAASEKNEIIDPLKTVSNQLIRSNSTDVLVPGRDEADQVFEEDFEDGMNGWTSSDLQGTAWHKSNFNQRGEDDLLWWCGDTLTQYEGDPVGYDNQWLEYLDTPVLDLSNAGDGLKLTFNAWWLLEDPRNVAPPAPYDGWDGFLVLISEDAGDSWDPLYPDTPEYTADHLSAADRFWGIGDLPGWTYYSTDGDWSDPDPDNRPDVEWVDCEFDLFGYNVEDVVFRFMVVSDRAVAAPYGNLYLAESGVCIDNILITDDDDELYLLNGADDDPIPDELTPNLDPEFSGDYWELTDEESQSGDWSMWNDDDHFHMVNALDSPPFEMPSTDNIWFQFWVYCNMPDFDSDGNNALEDFYQIYISADDGESWEYITHDYYRDGAGHNEWVSYEPGVPFTGNTELDLSDWADSTVQLRWIFRTDMDDEGGDGDGLFIDDVQVLSAERHRFNTAMTNFVVPYPTTVGFRLGDMSVDCHNEGIESVDRVPARWGYRGIGASLNLPINPRPSLEPDETTTLVISDYFDRNFPGWTPVTAGNYPLWAQTELENDGDTSNDTAWTENLTVLPIGLYELGYDARLSETAYNFDQGSGALTRFSPQDSEIDEYSIAALSFIFNGLQDAVDFDLHIFAEGDDDSEPGDEILISTVTVPSDSSFPNTMTVNLFEEESLRMLSGDFWVWIEVTNIDNLPQIVGSNTSIGDGRYTSYDGTDIAAFDSDLMVHALVVPGEPADPNVEGMIQQLNFPDTFIGESQIMQYSLYSTGLSPLTITNVTSDEDAFVINWEDEVTLDPGKAITFAIEFDPTAESDFTAFLEVDSDDEEAPVIVLNGNGLNVSQVDEALPLEFGLDNIYPNPFNSTAQINFSLSETGLTSLKLFDISGRVVASLINDTVEAGYHSISVEADDLPAGVYMMKLESGSMQSAMKVVLMK